MENLLKFEKNGYTAVLKTDEGKIESLEFAGIQVVDKSGLFGVPCKTLKGAEDKYIPRFTSNEQGLLLEDEYEEMSYEKSGEDFAEFKSDNTKVRYDFCEDALYVSLTADSSDFSAIGLELDVNFMDKDQNGNRMKQFLPSYPYTSSDGNVSFFGMNTPENKWICFLCLDKCDGWRIRYGTENPHELLGFQYLKHFDNRIKERTANGAFTFRVRVSFHNSLEEMLEDLRQKADIYMPRFDISAVPKSGKINFTVKKGYSAVRIVSPINSALPYSVESVDEETDRIVFYHDLLGFNKICVYSYSGVCTDAVFYVYETLDDLFLRSADAIRRPYHCDFNLCEGAMWADALLMREIIYGKTEIAEKRIKDFFSETLYVTPETVTDDDIGKIVPFSHTFNGKTYSPYHTYKLERVQNQVTAALCMLSAYKLYGEEKYLQLAKNYILNVIKDHMGNKNYISNKLSSEETDYTTVTALLIGFTDVALALKHNDEEGYNTVKEAAVRLADHLISRGMNFPTEGIDGRTEWEEGSISCTALSLLYVYRYLQKDEKYLSTAEQLLKFHDAFCIGTQDVRMYNSTLRWWETNWEGGAIGSAINAGHAWTVWKAEADYHYAFLKGDFKRAEKSFSAFATNFCKVSPGGEMYTCFIPDFIPSRPQNNKVFASYPENYDHSMPYYMWLRCQNTWLISAGVSNKNGLQLINCKSENSDNTIKIIPAINNLKILFYGGSKEDIEISTDNPILIIPCGKVKTVIKNASAKKAENGNITAIPKDGKIIIAEE